MILSWPKSWNFPIFLTLNWKWPIFPTRLWGPKKHTRAVPFFCLSTPGNTSIRIIQLSLCYANLKSLVHYFPAGNSVTISDVSSRVVEEKVFGLFLFNSRKSSPYIVKSISSILSKYSISLRVICGLTLFDNWLTRKYEDTCTHTRDFSSLRTAKSKPNDETKIPANMKSHKTMK